MEAVARPISRIRMQTRCTWCGQKAECRMPIIGVKFD